MYRETLREVLFQPKRHLKWVMKYVTLSRSLLMEPLLLHSSSISEMRDSVLFLVTNLAYIS